MKPNTIACAALFLLWQFNIAGGSSTFQYKLAKRSLSKPTGSITSSSSDQSTVFLVTDSSGIGRATITLVSGQWPKHIALRFRYEKGRGFRRLEGFALTTASVQVRGGMSDSRKMPFHFLDAQGKYETRDAPSGEMNILVEERNKAIEVILPPNLLIGSKTIKLEWIDAYR